MTPATEEMVPTTGCALDALRGPEEGSGTATPFHDLFLLQVPPPWPRIALASPGVPPGIREALAAAARVGRRAYALLIDADGTTAPPADTIRVLHVRRPDGPARRMKRRELLVSRDVVGDALAVAATGEGALPPHEVLAPPARELLVCTHGERDGCCGRFGEAAYRHLRDRHEDDDLRVWRVSHFGGHRFAPTLVDLPDGRCWGRLAGLSLDALVRRDLPPRQLARSYRGWCALPAEVQAVERELLLEHGWAWLDAALEIEHADAPPGGTRSEGPRDLVLRYALAAGRAWERDARIVPLPPVPVRASCGADETPTVHYACAELGARRPAGRLPDEAAFARS